MEGAPDQVEGGDFVGEEFDGEQGCAGGNYRPGFYELEGGRERDVSEAGQQAQGGYGGVDVQAGGEGYGGQDGEEFGERDLQEVEHGSSYRRSIGFWVNRFLGEHGERQQVAQG